MHSRIQIQMIADTLLPGFLPKDPEARQLVFHFTIPPAKHYQVRYEKNAKGQWEFIDFEPVEF